MDPMNKKVVIDLLTNMRREFDERVRVAIDALSEWRPREYAVDVEIPPTIEGVSHDLNLDIVRFGVDCLIEDTCFRGIPETGTHKFGVEFDFIPDTLQVRDEDAPHFTIYNIYFAARAAWIGGKGVSASRFAERVEIASRGTVRQLVFGEEFPVAKHCEVVAHVTNVTQEPRRFRARLVGRERG